uniref:Cyclin-like domain-containing protein n=2 Tax=Octactis speculum TaxID=3111310 RepID=A0A7S2B1V0_9STRA|mmetsp:Transcript_18530/g.25141  ORF Transcript_18530/g.25141 Transcript_18530/m.25141 type:complete len:342 (+) Transcript_18530:238-1263(+)
MKSWILGPDFLRQSPSRADNISEEDEKRCRRRTAIYMEKAGEHLKFPRLTIATAQVFFHRFYALQSFKKFRRFDIAVTCLFLAGKVEEYPRKLESVIQMCHQIWNKLDKPTLNPDSQDYEFLRLTILRTERQILHTIAFDLCVKHPYKDLIDTVKKLHQAGLIEEKQKREFAQSALNFLNDSMRTSICLQFEPKKIASATIYLATVYMNMNKPEENPDWMKKLEINHQELASICEQIMEVYVLTLKDEPSKNNMDQKNSKMHNLRSQLVRSGYVPESTHNSHGSTIKHGKRSGNNFRRTATPSDEKISKDMEEDRASKKARNAYAGILPHGQVRPAAPLSP